MTSNLQDDETDLDQKVISELIALTPEWWKAFSLEVSFSIDSGNEKYSHRIASLEDHRDIVVPSEKLFDLTYRLGQLFLNHGRRWQSVKYVVRRLDDGSWKYTVDFAY